MCVLFVIDDFGAVELIGVNAYDDMFLNQGDENCDIQST